MALIETKAPVGAPVGLHKACLALLAAHIEETKAEIKRALWQVPADIERAKLLVSKLTGLRIASGDRPAPTLKTPMAAMRAQGRAGADAMVLLAK